MEIFVDMRELELIAHNIRSRENVGALFRLADSLGVKKIWLTGYTPTPPDEKIHKVALGAEQFVSFEVEINIENVFQRLTAAGCPVYALECAPGATPLASFAPPSRFALLLGTETTGIAPRLLERCQEIIMIPQKGKKESMNVAIATGIACWHLLEQG
jgi:tRNA G18 (ribose-2'-O)-methylase SpoU